MLLFSIVYELEVLKLLFRQNKTVDDNIKDYEKIDIFHYFWPFLD